MKKLSVILILTLFITGFIAVESAEAKRFGGFGSFGKRGGFFKPVRKSNPFLSTKRYSQTPAKNTFSKPSSQQSISNYQTKTNRFQGSSTASAPKLNTKQKLYHKDKVRSAAQRNPNYNQNSYHDRWNRQYGNARIPGSAFAGSSFFGGYNSMFLWMMLMNGMHSPFYYHNQSDPGVQEWRQEAEKQAESDPEIKAKLEELDQKATQMEAQGIPKEEGYLPNDVDPDLVYSKEYVDSNPDLFYDNGARVEEANPMGTVVVALLVLFGAYWFALGRKRPDQSSHA